MHYTKTLKFGLITITSVLCAVLIFQCIHIFLPSLVSARVGSGRPARIIIPRIHVDAEVEEVSKTEEGLINPPRFALNTGWYKSSPMPGEEGSAVINGYVHWRNGYTAMFADLHFLKPGDIVSIKNDKGIDTSFVVREIKTYDLDADIKEALSSYDGKSHLNLVTFDGSWDKPSKSYSKRLVVFTDEATTTMDIIAISSAATDYKLFNK